ncbi:MAG: helix-turn-helix transcriptional regulator [Anaerolineae bacterium]|nr:helix-turn-helix transcriptional regulator [Anaerolineae bacterium]
MSVKHAILALLYNEELHGYEISKRLPLTLNAGWEVKPGQVASTLTRLESAALLTHHAEAGNDAPERKVYRLTDQGKRELIDWLLTPEVRDYRSGDDFYLKLIFCLIGAPVDIAEVIRQQRRQLYQELHDVTQLREQLDAENDLPFQLLLDTAIMHLDADIRWLEMCEVRLPELRRYRPPQPPPLTRGRPRSGVKDE